MNSEKATAVSPSSSPRARVRATPAYSTCSGVRL